MFRSTVELRYEFIELTELLIARHSVTLCGVLESPAHVKMESASIADVRMHTL